MTSKAKLKITAISSYSVQASASCVVAQTRLWIAIILLVSCVLRTATAQVYPVQGNAAMIPPYSVYLADYTSRTTDRLVLNVVLQDIARPELPVRLRLRIEGQNIRIETKPEFIGSRLALQGGIPLRLTGTDLIEYFNPANLNFTGITRREFEKSGALPQGFYQFCFEVLEYNRGVKISNTICAPAWLILNDPPIVNLPRNNEKIKAMLPQNVIIQWTPRHTGSPNSAFSTEYEIEMVEVWPASRNPNDAILTSSRILEATTRATSFIYGPSETPLELGRKYAFRIKAKSIVGTEEFDLFKNNGYSEVYSFTFGDVCSMPLNLVAKSTSASKFMAQWDAQFNHTSFQVRYREAGKSGAQWFTTSALINEAEISSLRSNTTYEVQVAGSCGPFESLFTTVATVKTNAPPAADYSCGLPMQNFNLDPSSLIASLNVGDIIQAGDFDVQLTKVRGNNGMFTGEGVVVVPFLNNVKVKTVFTDIKVNKENRMVAGYMNVTGAALDIIPDKITAMMDQLDETLDKVEEGLNKAEDVVNTVDEALAIAENVINEVAAYLPDEIVQQIQQAKAGIVEAKADMSAASTPEAKEAAKVELKEARQKMKDGVGKAMEHYAKAIVNFSKIIVQVIKELKDEALSNKMTDEEYQSMIREIEQSIYAKQGLSRVSSPINANGFIDIGSMTEEFNGEPAASEMKTFEQKVNDFLKKKRTQLFIKTMVLFASYYTSEEAIRNNFKSDLTINGEEVIKEVLTRMKNKQSNDEIKDYLKNYLRTRIEEVAAYLTEANNK
jgi:hypothetical protein